MHTTFVLALFNQKKSYQSKGAIYFTVDDNIEISFDRPPDCSAASTKSAEQVGIQTNDYPLCRFKPLVKIHEKVNAGTPVMVDRHRNECLLTSSFSGVVSSINFGSRRLLQSITIDKDPVQTPKQTKPIPSDSDGVKQCLQENGLWPAIRSRPFGSIANPDQSPAALFITATQSNPMTPNVQAVIKEYKLEFAAGLKLLDILHAGRSYLCVNSDDEQFLKEVTSDSENRKLAVFKGMYSAGLTGTHIHMIDPIKDVDHPIWHIDYQDVISFGHLKLHGEPWNSRVIALVGSAVKTPGIIKVPIGASLKDITTDELLIDNPTCFSGSVTTGVQEYRTSHFLGRYHHQVTAVMSKNKDTPGQKISSESDRPSRNTLIPFEVLGHSLPKGILAVPLLRALLVGDIEQAKQLGVLSFVEEDFDLARLLCCSGANYPMLLRRALNQLAKQMP